MKRDQANFQTPFVFSFPMGSKGSRSNSLEPDNLVDSNYGVGCCLGHGD